MYAGWWLSQPLCKNDGVNVSDDDDISNWKENITKSYF